MKTALSLREYEDVLDVADIYSLLGKYVAILYTSKFFWLEYKCCTWMKSHTAGKNSASTHSEIRFQIWSDDVIHNDVMVT